MVWKNSGQSVSSGTLSLLSFAGESALLVSLGNDEALDMDPESAGPSAKAKEEHSEKPKESRLMFVEKLRVGRRSCRLSLETRGLPTNTGNRSCISSSMLE